MSLIFTIIGGLVVFTIIVLVHELGHFIAAKKSGVKVEEFAVGFPPRVWSWKKGETTYAVNAIPFGGYVKLLGEDGTHEDDPKSMASKPAYIRLLILVAGVAFNLLFAYIVLVGIYIAGVSQPNIPGLASQPGVESTIKVHVQSVEKGTPAAKEGLQKGDVIEKVDGKSVKDTGSVVQTVQDKVNQDKNAKINMVISRNGHELTKAFSTYAAKEKVGNKEVDVKRIGVVLGQTGKISAGPLNAFRAALTEIGYFIPYYLSGFVQVIGKIFSSLQVPRGASGPLGIFILSGDMVQAGLSIFVQWLVLLSVALGILNILPIMPLDGGHAFIITIESIVRRKIPQNVKLGLSLAGWIAFGFLFIILTLNDLNII